MAARNRVRVDGPHADPDGRDVVRREDVERARQDELRQRLARGIGAAIEEQVRVVRKDPAVAVDGAPQPDAAAVTRRVRPQLLLDVAAIRTGRPARRDRSSSTYSSIERPLPPKSPPMIPLSMSISSSGMSSAAESWARSENGALFVVAMWTLPSGREVTIAPWVSM